MIFKPHAVSAKQCYGLGCGWVTYLLSPRSNQGLRQGSGCVWSPENWYTGGRVTATGWSQEHLLWPPPGDDPAVSEPIGKDRRHSCRHSHANDGSVFGWGKDEEERSAFQSKLMQWGREGFLGEAGESKMPPCQSFYGNTHVRRGLRKTLCSVA